MGLKGRLKEKFSGKFPEFGAIFMSNESTREECFDRKLFGLPMSSVGFVKGVKVGMILFLFEYEKRQLHGVFKATSDGQLNIIPCAYSSSGKKFPAQVTFTRIWHCHPLPEHEFGHAIRDNYFATNRFNFGLSKDQVYRLLCLFVSRKTRLFLSQSFLGCGIRKRDPESSRKKRKTEKDRSNQTKKSAMKKLKGEIDIISDTNVQPPLCTGELTEEKDEVQLLDSGDLHIACKEFDTMHSNCSGCPEGPHDQSSLSIVASHSSTCGQESIPHSDDAIQIQPVSVGEELKESESSGNFDIGLGDYIPLLQSDDSDSLDALASPESGSFVNDPISLPFSASGLHEDTSKLVSAASPITKLADVCIKENAYDLKSPTENSQEDNNSDYINHTSVRGLYSDASNRRSSVFSRLNIPSREQDKEDNTEVDKSVQDIMEELQQMHDKWNKIVGMPRYVGRENEHNVTKKASVFCRLSWN